MLDFSNEKSIFLQVANKIENDIIRGVLLEDEQTLSTNELAKIYSINPNTAAKSLTSLVADEIIYKKRGVGMFVAKGAKLRIVEKRKSTFIDNYVKPLLQEAKNLGIAKETLAKFIMEENIG